MPTENRSSNTEMAAKLIPCPHCGQQDAFVEQLDSDASVVICQGRIDKYSACLARGPVGVQQHEGEDQPGHDQAVKEWNKRAAPKPHPEPIAWMVGTAFWWTKEEAERDAAATGLPVVPVGPMVDTAEVERLRTENIRLIEDRARFPDRPDDIGIMIGCHIGNLKNQAKSSEDYARKWRWKLEAAERKLAEHDALLIEVLPSLDLAAGAFKSAKPVRNKVKAAISASAVPSVAAEGGE